MDPNASLKDLRDAIKRLENYQAGLFPRPNLDDAIEDATTAFEALDEWLSKDGFLPSDWANNDSKIVGALRQLPWGKDVDINGGDLVDLVARLMAAADQPALLDMLATQAAEDFEEVEFKVKPGDSCQFGAEPGTILHRRWGGPGDCDEFAHGTITDAGTGKVLHDPNGA